MTTINLAVIAGDGIGPEVVIEGLKVLDVVSKKYGVDFKKTSYDLGAAYWSRLPILKIKIENVLIVFQLL